MAQSLDDGEFWLPPQFLTDDDILMDLSMTNNSNIKKSSNNKEGFDLEADATKSLFPFEFPYGFGAFGHSSSDLSSPVESVVGSTETESDEEDYIAGLTRQIAHSTLEDDAFAADKTKARFVSGSPQSTLCTVGRGCGCRQGSSRGSPGCQSQVSSPPETWDLLYAAAGEVARMRMNEESYGYHQHNGGLLCPPRKPSAISVPLKNHHPNHFDSAGGIYSRQHQLLSHQRLQATQFQQLKQQQQQQQMMKQQQGSSVWGGPQQQTQSKPNGLYQVGGMNRLTRSNSNNGRSLGLSPSAWPPLQHAATQQQQNGSGMRAVFLGAPSAKRECAGTGVFLPRRINTPTEPRKKSACSTVLLPAKVVQALNLNFDDKGAPFYPRFGSFMPESDSAALRSRNSNGVSYQKRNLRPQQAMSHEIRLPQEWTY
ncbi:TIP41-like protein [Citrus sinensis]|uniref:uncharacterized protein LOC102623650 isoform X1 n=1 Tax=Citrus sinensis TaxID=2711 RepID=UPI0003D789C1|nr:uncharacterized protein LOC102623650 isoform X1 [Citrus sinensis]KAH9672629.1 TIP41-like protein [Citrus sinensis]